MKWNLYFRSKAALTYEQAQNKVDDVNDNDDVSKGLRHLVALSKILKQKRIDQGSLLLASSEVKFNVDRYIIIIIFLVKSTIC